MNLYTKARKYIDMNRVKKLHEEKIKRKNIDKEIRDQIREELRNLNSPDFSNWRYDIDEGMTTSALLSTTLPATGDTDLAVTSLDVSSFFNAADASFNSGTDSGLTGGFSADDGIINFSGDVENSTSVLTNAVDLSLIDTVNISAIAGSNSNGGMVPNDNLYVTFVSPTEVSDPFTVIAKTSGSFSNVNITIPPEFRTSEVQIFLYSPTGVDGDQGRALKPFTIGINGLNGATMGSIPVGNSTGVSNIVSYYLRQNATQTNYKSLGVFLWENVQKTLHGPSISENPLWPGESPQYLWNNSYTPAPVSGRTSFGPTGGDNTVTDADYIYIGQYMYNTYKDSKLYGVSNISLRRKTPMNVFVSLDSPEATAFIRTDPVMKGLSAEGRKKKLLDMLNAGDKYLLQQLGITGSAARPSETIMPNSWEVAGTGPGGVPGYGSANTQRGLRPSAAERDAKNMRWDPHMKDWAPNLNLPKKVDAGGDDTEVAQVSPGGESQIDNMLLRGLQNGDYGTGPDIQRQIERLKKNMRNKAPGGGGFELAHYEPEGEVLSEKKRLKSPKDITSKIPGYYDGKPAPLGFPMSPPPKTVNGFHPDLVDGKKIANKFNRLDPQSAKAMPPTGNPHIDKKVRAAAKKPK